MKTATRETLIESTVKPISLAPRSAAYVAPNTAEVDKAKSELEKLFGKG